jgi:hypothetical protein
VLAKAIIVLTIPARDLVFYFRFILGQMFFNYDASYKNFIRGLTWKSSIFVLNLCTSTLKVTAPPPKTMISASREKLLKPK